MLELSVLKYAGRNLSVVMRFGSMAMLMLVMLVSLWMSVRSRSTVKRKKDAASVLCFRTCVRACGTSTRERGRSRTC